MEWAVDAKRTMPAKEEFDRLPDRDKAKVSALFLRLAEMGRIVNREKFRNLGQKSGKRGSGAELWEFKSFQDRFIGDFRPRNRFLVATYTKKKKDNLDPSAVARAVRVMAENDAFEASYGVS